MYPKRDYVLTAFVSFIFVVVAAHIVAIAFYAAHS